jgi:hypothetical protein
MRTNDASLFSQPLSYPVYSVNYEGLLKIVRRKWEMDKNEPNIPAAVRAPADTVYLSADGRSFSFDEWHNGDSDNTVYVEVARRNGRLSHGWVDSVSRKVVQVG